MGQQVQENSRGATTAQGGDRTEFKVLEARTAQNLSPQFPTKNECESEIAQAVIPAIAGVLCLFTPEPTGATKLLAVAGLTYAVAKSFDAYNFFTLIKI